MHDRIESRPQEIRPHRGDGVEKAPADRVQPVDHANPPAGKAEDIIAMLADRMRHREARR